MSGKYAAYCYDCKYGKNLIRTKVRELLPLGIGRVVTSNGHAATPLKSSKSLMFSWSMPRPVGMRLNGWVVLPKGEAKRRARERDNKKRIGWRKVGGSRWIKPEKILEMRAQQGGNCFYCGDPLPGDITKNHLDHIIPKSRGGSHKDENLCLACPICNTAKGSLTPDEFAALIRKLHRRIDKWLPATKQLKLKLVA